jgi:hypothetical protein
MKNDEFIDFKFENYIHILNIVDALWLNKPMEHVRFERCMNKYLPKKFKV